MTEAFSLGDILGEALRASAACQPEPPPLVAWTDEEIAFHYNWLAARNLAARIADHYGRDFDAAWQGLGYVPDDMLPLLETPAGWTVLADYVARDLGSAACTPFQPLMH